MSQLVYALHDFAAENPDELPFKAGETIIVVERDELYGDGWWKGRTMSGEEGLFPQAYTSTEPPIADPLPATAQPTAMNGDKGSSSNGLLDPVDEEASSARETAPSPIEDSAARARAVSDAQSETPSMISNDSLDRTAADTTQEAEQNGLGHEAAGAPQGMDDRRHMRAILAAKAAAEAEKRAFEEKVRAEERRRAEAAIYADERAGERASVPIAGLEFSDESEDEDDDRLRQHLLDAEGFPRAPARQPSPPRVVEPVVEEDEAASVVESPAQAVAEPAPPATAESNGDPLTVAAATQLPASPLLAQEESAEEKVDASSVISRDVASEAEPVQAEAARDVAATETEGEQGAVTATEAPEEASEAEQEAQRSVQPPTEAAIFGAATALGVAGTALAAHTALEGEETVKNSPEPDKDAAPAQFEARDSDSGAADLTPRLEQTEAPAISAILSEGESTTTQEGRRRPTVSTKSLQRPEDPMDWSVDDVVDWGKSHGFDDFVLGKLREHEISGDVLLEFDVNTLKEIDIPAFGRRVHIFRAIKTLKARSEPAAPPPESQPFSPAMSGYEPDSPASTHILSPTVASSMTSPDLRRSTGSGRSQLDKSTTYDDIPRRHHLAPARSIASQLSQSHDRSLAGGTMGSLASTASSIDHAAIPEDKPLGEGSKHDDTEGTEGSRSTASLAKASEPESTAPSTTPSAKKAKEGGIFAGALRRERKPPPRVPSALISDEMAIQANESARRERLTKSRNSDKSRRSSRLFNFGSGSERSETEAPKPQQPPTRERRAAPVPPSTATAATNPSHASPMTEQIVDPVTAAMLERDPERVVGGHLLTQIGRPDHSGWMAKRGERYPTWKQRFFVLKGPHLYYLKSETENRIKGFIDLTGYRILSDAGINPGQYAFKIVSQTGKPHYFSSGEMHTIREWMKAMMKASVKRDYKMSVVSSVNIKTIPLAEAQMMNPPPRPPSPTSRARVQAQRYAGLNPDSLTPKDAEILMNAPGSPPVGTTSPNPKSGMKTSRSRTSIATSPLLGGFNKRKSGFGVFGEPEASDAPSSRKSSGAFSTLPDDDSAVHISSPQERPKLTRKSTSEVHKEKDLLRWLNASLPVGSARVKDYEGLRSGRAIVRALERKSGRDSGITDDEFATFKPTNKDVPTSYFTTCFKVFDFIGDVGVPTDEMAMNDIFAGGEEANKTELLERMRTKFP